MIWIIGYAVVGISFALATNIAWDREHVKPFGFDQWLYCVLLWPIILLAAFFLRS